jgi:hypothetical protein
MWSSSEFAAKAEQNLPSRGNFAQLSAVFESP